VIKNDPDGDVRKAIVEAIAQITNNLND
jgi:hypothetical protein